MTGQQQDKANGVMTVVIAVEQICSGMSACINRSASKPNSCAVRKPVCLKNGCARVGKLRSNTGVDCGQT